MHDRGASHAMLGASIARAMWLVLAGGILAASAGARAQTDDTPAEPAVPIVRLIGCAERDGRQWFLAQATEPTETPDPYVTAEEADAATDLTLGSERFHLVGVAEFLDADGLLDTFERADFTARESANATAQLAEGRRVLVKGLYLEDAEPQRINLTSVVSLAESC